MLRDPTGTGIIVLMVGFILRACVGRICIARAGWSRRARGVVCTDRATGCNALRTRAGCMATIRFCSMIAGSGSGVERVDVWGSRQWLKGRVL